MSYLYIKRKQIFFNGFPTTKTNFQVTFSISTKQDDKLLSHKLFPNKHLPQLKLIPSPKNFIVVSLLKENHAFVSRLQLMWKHRTSPSKNEIMLIRVGLQFQVLKHRLGPTILCLLWKIPKRKGAKSKKKKKKRHITFCNLAYKITLIGWTWTRMLNP